MPHGYSVDDRCDGLHIPLDPVVVADIERANRDGFALLLLVIQCFSNKPTRLEAKILIPLLPILVVFRRMVSLILKVMIQGIRVHMNPFASTLTIVSISKAWDSQAEPIPRK